jgi:Flp pilus assembly pilin Flp
VLYLLLNRINSILSDERGSTFIESGLWIGLVVLVMAGAGIALANTIDTKFDALKTSINGVNTNIPTN